VRRRPLSIPSAAVPGGKLDRYRAGQPDDFRLILTPVIVIFTVGGFGDSLEVIKQKSIENVDMLKGLNFVAIISLMGWGLGYFGQPHILARFMAADSHHSIVHASHQYDLDDPLPGGRVCGRLLRYRLLQ
jgi:hypothetical protein